ncbi:hypothetical protein NIES2104_09770 [Leptolyngbya sp. NIES-2104]|nr:hypothetical protein NIES2104_09770 [Leptolyngbya sp. NIES-2104]
MIKSASSGKLNNNDEFKEACSSLQKTASYLLEWTGRLSVVFLKLR